MTAVLLSAVLSWTTSTRRLIIYVFVVVHSAEEAFDYRCVSCELSPEVSNECVRENLVPQLVSLDSRSRGPSFELVLPSFPALRGGTAAAALCWRILRN